MFLINTFDIGDGNFLNAATGANNGPPLILMHGVLRGWRDFVPLWPALSPRWQVISIDHRGHGHSHRAPGRYHVRDYANDALALVSRCGASTHPVVLYGHSLGALCAVAIAAKRPHLVRAVILEDPPSISFLNNVGATIWHAIWEQMRPLAGRRSECVSVLTRELAEVRVPTKDGEKRLGELRDPTSLRFSARCLQDLDPEVFEPLLRSQWLADFDCDSAFDRVQCPALILRGDESLGGMLSRPEADRFAARMADAAVVDVAGAGHLIHWQATETTARLVLGFLESL